ncbi:Sbal_3080 family lipoprotein [Roseateles sp. BYS180W]|uniref:Sbal_3080 family lipoprotein n=1 Tax=Roseateles rivi TaxID=3299028 RepID=A0ABW7FRZ3_9BURK
MKFITIIGTGLAFTLSGCAIHQNVKPVGNLDQKQVCVIENPSIRSGFLDAYVRSLNAKGYQVRKLPLSASLVECNITSTYTAHWRWDLALYMAYAEIKVYNVGKPIGEAKYDATRGMGSMNKFIDADKKISELVDQLFPGGAGLAPAAPPKDR